MNKGVLTILCLSLLSSSALAEERELSAGLEGGALFPGYESLDNASFALATWHAAVKAEYGLTDNLSLSGRFSFGYLGGGKLREVRNYRGQDIEGINYFSGEHYYLEVGARWVPNFLAGYPVTPYVEGGSGFQWQTFRQQDLRNDLNETYDLGLSDEGELTWIVSAGVGVEMRFADLVRVGIGLRYLQGLSGTRFERALVAGVSFSFWKLL